MSATDKQLRDAEMDPSWAYGEAVRQLRAELAAAENLVTALTTQRAADAVSALRAVEEAREEQRKQSAEEAYSLIEDWTCPECDHDSGHDLAAEVESQILTAPLTATPLAERIKELEARIATECPARMENGEFDVEGYALLRRAEKAEARVKELEAHAQRVLERVGLPAEAFQPLREVEVMLDRHDRDLEEAEAERDALKAELAALKDDFGRVDDERLHQFGLAEQHKAQIERLTEALEAETRTDEQSTQDERIVAVFCRRVLREALKEKTP